MKQKIKFICEDTTAMNYWTPKPAKDWLPEWYEKIPKPKDLYEYDEEVNRTIRGCIPVEDIITAGYIIPNIYEIRITEKIENFKKEMLVRTGKRFLKTNLPDQGLNTREEIAIFNEKECPITSNNKLIKKNYFRIHSDWAVVTPPGYSCLIMQPYYFFERKFQIMPCIIDTDTYNKRITFVGYSNEDYIKFHPGDPLLQVIPFKRDDWKMEISNEKILDKGKFFLYNVYKNVFHKKKSFE